MVDSEHLQIAQIALSVRRAPGGRAVDAASSLVMFIASHVSAEARERASPPGGTEVCFDNSRAQDLVEPGAIAMTVQSMFAQPSGFIANNGAAPPNIPLKVGYRPRQKPDLSLRLDGWMLSPQTLRSIAADLDRQAAAAHQARAFRDRDTFAAAADEVAGFITDRQRFERSVWR